MKHMQLKALCCLLLLAAPAQAEEAGVAADRILFGQVAAMSGPSSALGVKMRQGILAAFAEVNAKGGVHGRKLELISRDDGYDPDRSVMQTFRLIEEDKVFGLIGAVGTPTSLVTVPIAKAQNIPFIGPFTGAAFLRGNDLTNVVNIRASYAAEAEILGQASDGRPSHQAHRDLLPGRPVRPRRPHRRQARVGKAQLGARGRSDL